jgi:hypothetical protein
MKVVHVLNLGAGVQSTALYLMLMKGELEGERLDCAIFADTQDESKAVYRHLEWLRSLGGPPILVRTIGRLGDDLIDGVNSTGQRFASIPAFTTETEGVPGGITRRQCTREYKTRVVEQTIKREVLGLKPRQRVPSSVKVARYFGLSFDEPDRIIPVKARVLANGWGDPRFPLFDEGITRFGCERYNEQHVPHRVPRSACVFCPFRQPSEWRDLRDNHPEDWERACQVDEALRSPGALAADKLNQRLYVHRSCLPLRRAPIDKPDEGLGLMTTECEGMCGV